jgi:hypothetical protein
VHPLLLQISFLNWGIRMKYIYAITLLLALSFIARGQVRLNFTVMQYPLLAVHEGDDSTVKRGAIMKLGSAAPASGGSGHYKYAWTPMSGLDSPAIASPLALVDSSITYTLTVTDSVTGCSQTAVFGLQVLDSVNLRIFPNPTGGVLYITTNMGLGGPSITIEVIDVLGRRLYLALADGNGPLNSRINLSGKAKGLYFIRILGATAHLTRKIIVK